MEIIKSVESLNLRSVINNKYGKCINNNLVSQGVLYAFILNTQEVHA
jgi:hypothetical protein